MLKHSQPNSIIYFKRLLWVLAVMFQSACSVFGIQSEEEAKYELVLQQNNFQLRQYAPMIVAETVVDSNFDKAGSEAFKRLFGYISGDNQRSQAIAMTSPVLANADSDSSSQKISMTAPVITNRQTQGWRYYFVLPRSFSITSAPTPTNSLVTIKKLPAKKVAVIEYSGLWSEEVFNEKTARLTSWMLENNYEPDSLPSFAGYNPPWTLPFLRRNEVLIDIKN